MHIYHLDHPQNHGLASQAQEVSAQTCIFTGRFCYSNPDAFDCLGGRNDFEADLNQVGYETFLGDCVALLMRVRSYQGHF